MSKPPTPQIQMTKFAVSLGELISFLSIIISHARLELIIRLERIRVCQVSSRRRRQYTVMREIES